MTSTSIQGTEFRTALAKIGEGNYLAAYDQIVAETEQAARTGAIVNRKASVERFKAGIAENPRKTVAEINALFTDLPKLIRKNVELSENTEPRQLLVKESETLMDEILAIKKAEDALAARKEEVKRLAFGHLTEMFAEDGEDFPQLINGSIDVPTRGHRFAREAAGFGEPKLQEKVLKSLVDDDTWGAITDRDVTVVETVNLDKLMALAASRPELLTDLQRSLKVGDEKLGRLNVRPL